MNDMLRLALYASVAFALFAARASAQDPYQAPPSNLAADGVFRLSVGGQFGFGGEAVASQGGFEAAANLDDAQVDTGQFHLDLWRHAADRRVKLCGDLCRRGCYIARP